MADKVHCIRKTLRLMPQEAKVLSDKAKANGMNEAEYIRLLISQKPNDYPEVRKLLKELINEVNRIGININQIVFNSNAQLYSKKDKEQLETVLKLLGEAEVTEQGKASKLDVRMKFLEESSPLGANHPAVKQYNKCMRGAGDTVRSIIISANSRLAFLENKQV